MSHPSDMGWWVASPHRVAPSRGFDEAAVTIRVSITSIAMLHRGDIFAEGETRAGSRAVTVDPWLWSISRWSLVVARSCPVSGFPRGVELTMAFLGGGAVHCSICERHSTIMYMKDERLVLRTPWLGGSAACWVSPEVASAIRGDEMGGAGAVTSLTPSSGR